MFQQPLQAVNDAVADILPEDGVRQFLDALDGGEVAAFQLRVLVVFPVAAEGVNQPEVAENRIAAVALIEHP